ncbi:MAG: class I SAM-dependent RNA methyltransferase [Candidatus Gracilibacteria bacterium]|nr:class I SAM-dependent RNA methyltransferase [Candidatus Gracilibacteria bacterium]
MEFLITTAPGLESLVKRECEKIGQNPIEVTDRSVRVEGGFDTLAELNIWLRCANRVYLVLAEGFATDFDDLFAIAESIDWKKYRPKDAPILVESVTHKSALTSEPAIQRTVKKAIIDSLTRKDGDIIPEIDSLPSFRILVLIREDKATFLLDSSGDPLHKRGYRQEAGDAPLKETLAAAMIYLSNWRYKELLVDPSCGSGTIPIEAAMIARNIAPGLRRHFAFEDWNWVDPKFLVEAREAGKRKIFPPGSYQIQGYDIDAEVIEKAVYNSKVAGVATDITWAVRDMTESPTIESIEKAIGLGEGATLISNPPYGERLETEDVGVIHTMLARIFSDHPELSGGVITNESDFIQKTRRVGLERRKLFNGSLECQYCYRKSQRKGK